MRVRNVIPFFSFLSLSVSLSTSFVPTRSVYLDYNLHVAMFDNDVTDEVKIINKYKIKGHLNVIN